MRARQRHWGNVLRRNPERECQRLATAGVRVERGLLEHRVEGGSLMAGQSVGMVKAEEPVADIVAQLMAQSEAALTRR